MVSSSWRRAEVNFAALSVAQEVTHPDISFLEQGALELNDLSSHRIGDIAFEQSGARRDAQCQAGSAVCRRPVVQTEEDGVGHRLRYAASAQHHVSLGDVKRTGSRRRTLITRTGRYDFVGKTVGIVLGDSSALNPDQWPSHVTVRQVAELQPTHQRAASVERNIQWPNPLFG